ncbi:DUF2066 domain-containing protein [Niveispirillum sp. KHB5.9]|uniref:DUF2066 domain-containing protein n=1 Tax=Niveispirillum sp. KHB5.9 TaxID=3400269 RepID=UPI003A8B1E6B
MPVIRTPALRKSLSAALVAVALALPAAGQGADDLFTIRDVRVDISSGNANVARDQGVREAQRKAFDLLFDRLTVDGARTALPPVASDSIERMVQSFEIQEERTSATRYVGRLAIRFNAASVRNYLRANGVSYAEVRSKPVLTLPVDQGGGTPVLWQAETGWRQAWADLAPQQGGLVPVTVPYGEAADVADIGVEQALAGDAGALRRIADRYKAGDVAVVVATGTAETGLTVNVSLHPVHGGAEHFTLTQSPLPADPAAVPGAVQANPTLRAAVEAVTHRFEERWTAATQIAAGSEAGMVLTVSFADQAGWQSVRKRLASVSTVTQAKVTSLSRTSAVLDLRHVGGVEQLRTALAQRDLVLEDGAEGPVLRAMR